jgi:hypothetical protein
MFAAVKGIIHEPSEKPTMKPKSRDALLTAIAKAREWIDDIRLGHFASFAEIAEREWHRTGGSDGHRLGRAGAEDRAASVAGAIFLYL